MFVSLSRRLRVGCLLLLLGLSPLLYPGVLGRLTGERSDLAALHPDFLPRVEAVLARLEAAGHPARLSATWRSPWRQDVVLALSRLSERLGRAPGTRVQGGASCHNQQLHGVPASAAADVRMRLPGTRDAQATFYKALGAAARAEGLRWGGDWAQRSPTWAAYGLGWDPGHIEARTLCLALRRGSGAL